MKFLNIINELFSQKFQQQLLQKFKDENPKLEDRIILYYLKRFQEIQNSPKVQEKDINKYSWKQLETLVDMNQPKSYEKNIKISPSDLIYNKNNLRIYRANTQQACIAYGNGYNFCISARGDESMYTEYRHAMNATIYFVFDDDRSRKQKPNGKFQDPLHLVVIMSIMDNAEGNPVYQVTTADNDGDNEIEVFDHLTTHLPKLKGLQDLFVPVPPDPREDAEYKLKVKYKNKIPNIPRELHFNDDDSYLTGINLSPQYIKLIHNVIVNQKPIFRYEGYNNRKKPFLSQIRIDNRMTPKQWADYMNDQLGAIPNDAEDVYSVKYAKIRQLNFSQEFITYLNQIWNVMSEYLAEKNKLNIMFK